jgi:GAF domain-containing protein
VADAALAEVNRLPGDGVGFILLGSTRGGGGLTTPDGLVPGPISAVRPGEGIVGAIAGGDPEIVTDAAGDPRRSDADEVAASLIAAPLKTRGSMIGVIGAATSELHEYRAADLKVLTAIAALTGPAIDQARAHEAAVRSGTR